MGIFPTIGQLLLPNWNIATIIGTIAILLGMVGLYLGLQLPKNRLTKALFGVFNLNKISITLIIIGIFLVWGVSMIADFLKSAGGALIFWGVLVVAVLGFLLFYQPKKLKSKTAKKIFMD